MIYTITMNPALDYVVDLPEFKTGTVNRASQEHIFYGGKGINVAVVLKELGFSSCNLGFIAGFTGKKFKQGVEAMKIESDFIEVEKGLTRINVKIHSQQETELNGLGPIIDETALKQLFKQLEQLQINDVLILSGSVPASLDQNIYQEIIKYVSEKEVKVVVDATGDLLVKTLKYRPFLIKPNNHELAQIFNVELTSIEETIKYAYKLQEMGAVNVLISMAKDGSLLIDEHGKCHRMGVCQGTVKNSVGAGDSMVAGFVAGCLLNYDYSKTLKLATACGGATAFSHGLATKDKIDELIKQL